MTGGGEGRCIAEFVVGPENVNQGGALHGGLTATIVDTFTTYTLLTKDCNPGVTVDLHVRLVGIVISRDLCHNQLAFSMICISAI